MTSILDDINGLSLIEKSLETAISKYSLQRDEFGIVFSNKNCSIKFWPADYQAFGWCFYDPNAKHVYYYDISKYVKFVLNRKAPNWVNINKVETLYEITLDKFEYYNDIIIDYLDKPLTGDFSWHKKYIEEYKVDLKLTNFAFSAYQVRSEEGRDIARSFRRREEGSKNALLEYLSKNYLNNGEQFEIYHEDNSIHKIMKKFDLKVPFYFSHNNDLYKVIETNDPNDFGQIYWLDKHLEKFHLKVRCDFAIHSKFDEIEILTEQEFSKLVEKTLSNTV